MVFSNLLAGAATQEWLISQPTDRNMFRLSPTSTPAFVDGRPQAAKIEIAQINDEEDVFNVQLRKYETYHQLLFLPLPIGWTNQRIGVRRAHSSYPDWSFLLEVDSVLSAYPSGINQDSLNKIQELIRVTPGQAEIADSLILRLDCTGAFRNVAQQQTSDEILEKLNEVLGCEVSDRTDYVKIYEDKLNGPD